jgi:molecular chaperone GrpE
LEPATGVAFLDQEVPEYGAGNDMMGHESTKTIPDLQTESQLPSLLLESSTAEDDTTILLDRLARMQAEFENARKRVAKEQEDFREYAAFETIKSLMPVLDSLEEALKPSSLSSERDILRRGMQLIYKQLIDILCNTGVRTIASADELFNPEIHQAVGTVETESIEEGKIVKEFQPGYKFKDRLLRPAMVLVSKRPSSS